MSARQDPPDPEAEDLRRVVAGVAGVATAEVVKGDAERPTVRVHLDGSSEPDVVLAEVRAAVASWRRPAPQLVSDGRGRPRRGGLGRGLGVLLAEATADSPEPEPLPARRDDLSVVDIAVTRGAYGTTVRAVDSEGTLAVVLGVGDDVDPSVVSAVATLADHPVPELLGVTTQTVAEYEILTVVLRMSEGDVRAAAATVRADRWLALGEATWTALQG